jgi:protein-tyrosine-phosphatase/DNA-binding transcriptional ArsR family regulator
VTTAVHASPPQLLQLLGDTQRWQLLTELSQSDRRVGELCALVGQPQNLVSYHLGQLRRAGLVSARRSSADGRDSYYRVDVHRCGELLCGAGSALDPALRLGLLPPAPEPGGRRRRPRVLFLCTGNSARPQMAEALLAHRTGHRVDVHSAGSHPKALHPNAVRVMAERGIDISGNTTKHLDRYARRRFDHVVTLCDKVREICPELPGQPATAHWSMADPSAAADDDAAGYPAFVSAAEELEVRLDSLIPRLLAPATERNGHAR